MVKGEFETDEAVEISKNELMEGLIDHMKSSKESEFSSKEMSLLVC